MSRLHKTNEIQHRLFQLIGDNIKNGGSRQDLVNIIESDYGYTHGTAKNIVSKAYNKYWDIVVEAVGDKQKDAIIYMINLRDEARAKGDIKIALETQKEINKCMGLHNRPIEIEANMNIKISFGNAAVNLPKPQPVYNINAASKELNTGTSSTDDFDSFLNEIDSI